MASSLSVAAIGNNQVVITWGDARWNNSMSYALVRSDGSLQTPPLTFMDGGYQPDTTISVSTTGQGVAAYDGSYRSFLPTINK
jgi:hypothetical protein